MKIKKQKVVENKTQAEFLEYKHSIERMNMAELQNHAVTLGLKPSTFRHILEKTLLNLFHKKVVPFYAEGEQTRNKSKQEKIDSVLSSWK